MSIVRKNRETIGIHRKGRDTLEVWRFIDGVWKSVWQFIKSCFGAGWWINNHPWTNKDGWRNK